MTRALPRITAAAVLALALLAAACGDDGGGGTTGPTSPGDGTTTGPTGPATTEAPPTTAGPGTTASPTTSPAASTTAAPTTTAPFDGDTGPKTAASQGTPSGLLGDVRWAYRTEGFTRIVFDFLGTDGIPAYNVEYQTLPFYNTAGDPVTVAGTAYLAVRLFPASRVDLSVDPYVIVYTGPERITVDAGSVAEIVFVDDFEAVMVWAIGLDDRRAFNVGTLTNPPRIYIDIAD